MGHIILGVVDTKGVTFGGVTVELKEKRHVLQKHEYEAAAGEVEPFIRRAMEFKHSEDTLL